MAVRIAALGGSLGQQSTSLAALRVALEGAADAGADVELFDIRELDLPMYSPNTAVVPPAARSLCESVYGCDGMLWSSPLYHGTISGSFKNALDWLQLLGERQPPYLTDKVIGLISTAGGTQGLQAVNTMEFIVRALRGWAVPLVIPIPQAWRVFQEGQVLDKAVASQLRALGAELARAAEHFSTGRITSPEAGAAEATLQPVSDTEVQRAVTPRPAHSTSRRQ
jgi:FMN reductase